jgi:hypothetical protein
MWKADIVSDEVGYLSEEISKCNVEHTALFLLTTDGKMQKERNK